MSPQRILTLPDRITPRMIAWLSVTAACVLFTAFGGAAYAIVQVSQQAGSAEDAASVSCKRTVQFGPPLADAYARYQILTPGQIAALLKMVPLQQVL